MKCLILAAGYATRLYPLTENFPKPLLKVGEKTILDWLLEDIHTFNGLFLKEVGFTPGVFTYPFGAYTDWTEQIVRSAGYTAAFTCREIRVVPRSKEDWLYRLGRYNRSGHEQTEHYFKRLSVY